jgi:hypothetical protein
MIAIAVSKPDMAALGITVNVVARGKHVSEVERYIRRVKERTRSYYNALQFQTITKLLVIEIV